MTDAFLPTGSEVTMAPSGKLVRIAFSDDNGKTQEAFFRPETLPILALQIQRQISPGQATPIDPSLLHSGQPLENEGFQIQPREGGGHVLTVFVRSPSEKRLSTLSFNLTPEVAAMFVERLS